VPFSFRLLAGSDASPRLGRLETPHGGVDTPAFMPVATRGMLRGIAPDRLGPLGAQMLLSNAFHLFVRPGVESVRAMGGLHRMLAWDGPVLTDSGGFQVFSLKNREISAEGVRFRNEVDGSSVLLTPERSVGIQNALGADVIMAFDECTPWPADEKLAATGVRRTLAWIERCLRAHARGGDQALFGIVQGSVYPRLRERCAEALVALDLPGYAIGGVSVGVPATESVSIAAGLTGASNAAAGASNAAQDDVAAGVQSRPGARVLEQHQGQQARRLGVVAKQPQQHAAEPNRLPAQVEAQGLGRRGAAVALVEDQVDDGQHRVESGGEMVG